MIKITYPGVNNFSTFAYDGLGRNISIVETTAGSVTSTKQFVWAQDTLNPYRFCEERDGSGVLTKKFFNSGQTISGSNYFYTADHLANPTDWATVTHVQQAPSKFALIYSPIFTSSIREMTNSSGIVQSQIAYDPYGRSSQLQGTLSPDFQFGDYYAHTRSGLGLTLSRAYSSNLGRFLSRDSFAEAGGVNLYGYMENHPVLGVDPSGKCALAVGVIAASPEAAIAAGALGAAAVAQAAALGHTIGNFVNSMSIPKPPFGVNQCDHNLCDAQCKGIDNYADCYRRCLIGRGYTPNTTTGGFNPPFVDPHDLPGGFNPPKL